MNRRHLSLVIESDLPPVGTLDEIRRSRRVRPRDSQGHYCLVLTFPLHRQAAGSGKHGAADPGGNTPPGSDTSKLGANVLACGRPCIEGDHLSREASPANNRPSPKTPSAPSSLLTGGRTATRPRPPTHPLGDGSHYFPGDEAA